MPLWYRVLLTWAVASAVFAWFYQLSGSEIIAFDAQKLVVICCELLMVQLSTVGQLVDENRRFKSCDLNSTDRWRTITNPLGAFGSK